MGECGQILLVLVVMGVFSLLSWLSKKKQQEQDAKVREDLRRQKGEPSPEPERSAATDLEAFLQQLAGKTKPETRRAAETPGREERPREEPRPRAAPAELRTARAPEPERLAERGAVESRQLLTPFESRRKEMEEKIAAARKAAEEMGSDALSEGRLSAAVAAPPGVEGRGEMLGLPAAALARGDLDRSALRRAVVMMEVLGRPRGLRDYDLPY